MIPEAAPPLRVRREAGIIATPEPLSSESKGMNPVRRRPCLQVKVDHVRVGGDAPIVVQSMTNTDTADIEGTVRQVAELARAGSEVVRVTVNTREAAAAVPAIRERLYAMGLNVPLVGDFHFNGHKLLAEVPECGVALSKYRINPGNVGRGSKRDPQFAAMIEVACRNDRPVRIGVNWGSLDQDLLTRLMDENSKLAEPLDAHAVTQEAMIRSALDSAERAVELGLPRDHIVLSCKVSGVQDLISVYRDIAARCDYPLHLGLTEAGMGSKGIVASTAAHGGPAAGRHRRHDPRLADARAGRRPHPGSHRGAGNAPDHGAAVVHADGDRLPGLRPHHQHLLPGTGAADPVAPASSHARMEETLRGRGRA